MPRLRRSAPDRRVRIASARRCRRRARPGRCRAADAPCRHPPAAPALRAARRRGRAGGASSPVASPRNRHVVGQRDLSRDRLGGCAARSRPRARSVAHAHAGDRLRRRRRHAGRADRHRRPGRRDRGAARRARRSRTLHAFVGYSYGALVGLQFAARHPQRLQQLVAVSGAHRAHPYAARVARAAAQGGGAGPAAVRGRAGAVAGAAVRDAELPHAGGIRRALRRRAADRRRPRARAPPRTISTPPARASSRARRSPRTLRLSESIDLHRVDPARRRACRPRWSRSKAIRWCRCPMRSRWSKACGTPGRLRVLRSHYGHDAFLKETIASTRSFAVRSARPRRVPPAVRHERRCRQRRPLRSRHRDPRGARRHRPRSRVTAR